MNYHVREMCGCLFTVKIDTFFKQVNVSVFEHENWENLLQENKTPECELRQISYQIEILK